MEPPKENYVGTTRDTVRQGLPRDMGELKIYVWETEISKVQLMYRYQLLIDSGQGGCQVMASA
jgi:hypothetical protein